MTTLGIELLSQLKKVTLQHCVDTLKNNVPAEEVKEATELKKTLNDLRMKDKSDDGFDLKEADYQHVLNKFKSMTILHMIWKQKGPAEILGNNRFIHMKTYLPRICEALVVGKMKEVIFAASSIFQLGGQPGHSPEEVLIYAYRV